jgi:ABC-2 type transport system permease protein
VLGLALGGITFLTARHSIGINEGVAGVFYVMSGIIFPITALPVWAQSISKALPVTYWMDSMRRALMPDAMAELNFGLEDVTGLGGFSDLYIMAYLAISTAFFFALSLAVFRFADGVARRKGKIDWTTAY